MLDGHPFRGCSFEVGADFRVISIPYLPDTMSMASFSVRYSLMKDIVDGRVKSVPIFKTNPRPLDSDTITPDEYNRVSPPSQS